MANIYSCQFFFYLLKIFSICLQSKMPKFLHFFVPQTTFIVYVSSAHFDLYLRFFFSFKLWFCFSWEMENALMPHSKMNRKKQTNLNDGSNRDDSIAFYLFLFEDFSLFLYLCLPSVSNKASEKIWPQITD